MSIDTMTTQKYEVSEELLASLLADYKKPEDPIGENGLLKQLTKRLVEKALEAELTEHLGHDRHESVANKCSVMVSGELRERVDYERHSSHKVGVQLGDGAYQEMAGFHINVARLRRAKF